jgi:carbon monoxide dehydrogenase subunit G
LLLCLGQIPAFAGSVTLTWNPSTDTNAVGYKIYYGGNSGVYTNTVSVGSATSVTISGLLEGATYYFSATTVSAVGVESAFSNEATFVLPVTSNNSPVDTSESPTLDAIANVTVNENAGQQTVNLTGISAGTSGNATVNVYATASDNGAIISAPVVNYTASNSAGTLTFIPVLGAFGTSTITVTVDNGGATNNPISQTFIVTVQQSVVIGTGASTLPPTLDAITNVTIYENAGSQTVNLTGIGAGTSGNATVNVYATASDNGAIISAPVVIYTNSNSTGTLTFTPVAGATGTSTVTVIVDNGGATNNPTSQEFTVTVLPTPVPVITYPPTLDAITNVTIYENACSQTVNLTGIGAGTSGNATVNVYATASDNGAIISAPVVIYTNSNPTGTLTFTPVAGATGTSTVTVTVDNGGTTNNPTSQTFTVTVVPAPIPTLNTISNLTILQNAGVQTVALTGISPGYANGSALVTVGAATGNPSIIQTPAVSYTSPNNSGSLNFAPMTNALGSAILTVTVSNGLASFTQTFSVTVVAPPTNQPPTLDPISNLSVVVGSGSKVITLTGIRSGLVTGTAKIRVTAASSNSRIISSVTVNYTNQASCGTLILQPSSQITGVSIITVTVNNGAKSNNVVQRTFTVSVVPTPPPTLNPIANVSVVEGSSPQTIIITGISAGAGVSNEALKVSATSSNPRLIANPIVQYTSPANTALLTFRPPAKTTGTATISVTVSDNNRNNNSFRQSFTVTVTSNSVTTSVVAAVAVTSAPAVPAVATTSAVSAAVVAKTSVSQPDESATLSAASHAANEFSFQVTGISGDKYIVQTTSDLVHWTSVETNTAPFTFQDNTVAGTSRRFYRAVYGQ